MRLSLILLVIGTLSPLAVSQPPGQYKPWGPSWVGGGPPGGYKRPAKLEENRIQCHIASEGSPAAVVVSMWCDLADLKLNNKYELKYQCRLHTKKGSVGILLGDAQIPASRAYTIATGTADAGWNGLEETFDLTRRDLSTMTNLPKVEGGVQTVFIRVEPQIFDVTANKFLTPSKTSAIIVVAGLAPRNRITRVNTLADWLVESRYESSVDSALSKLADLDEYSAEENRVGSAIQRVLEMKDVSAKVKAKMIPAIPDIAFSLKENHGLEELLKELAKSDDAGLKAAAEERLKKVKR